MRKLKLALACDSHLRESASERSCCRPQWSPCSRTRLVAVLSRSLNFRLFAGLPGAEMLLG